jgi:hypothetical protein
MIGQYSKKKQEAFQMLIASTAACNRKSSLELFAMRGVATHAFARHRFRRRGAKLGQEC